MSQFQPRQHFHLVLMPLTLYRSGSCISKRHIWFTIQSPFFHSFYARQPARRITGDTFRWLHTQLLLSWEISFTIYESIAQHVIVSRHGCPMNELCAMLLIYIQKKMLSRQGVLFEENRTRLEDRPLIALMLRLSATRLGSQQRFTRFN